MLSITHSFDEPTKPMIYGEELVAQRVFIHIKVSIITGDRERTEFCLAKPPDPMKSSGHGHKGPVR